MHFKAVSNFVFSTNQPECFEILKTVAELAPDGRNAIRMQHDYLKCTSNQPESATNFHSYCIGAGSGSSVTGV